MLPDLGDRPLVVLTAEDTYPNRSGTVKDEANQARKQMQRELVALSSNATHREIPGSTHESLVYEQRAAEATMAGILQSVAAVREGKPLDGGSQPTD